MYLPTNSGIKLGSVLKNYSLDQDKIRPPSETVEWAKECFNRLPQQILQKVQRIDTRQRLNIPVYISICTEAATALIGTQRQMGKGAFPNQAKASALMELAERFSFFHFIYKTPFPKKTVLEIPGPIIDFTQVAKAVHHPSQDLNRARKIYELLPQTWTWAHNLTNKRDEMIPLGWFYTINEYNGPAAGNCQEEAILQSLCEVIERHVSALVTLKKLPTPAIRRASINDPICQELMKKLEDAGIQIFLKDFSCDMGIPSVAALCWDPSTFPNSSEIIYAAGTATSPAKALIRALTEVAQLAGEFCTHTNYKASALPKFNSIDQANYVIKPSNEIDLNSLPNLSQIDLYDEIKACVAALNKRNYSVYTLDVTHPELRIPTVYTIIPGAHFASRTTDTDVIFHTIKLISQLSNPKQAMSILSYISPLVDKTYYLYFFKALVLINLEYPEEALTSLDTALTLNPPPQDEANIHTHRGVALKNLGRYIEAIKALKLAASFSEPHHEIFNLLGFCHFMLKEYENAIEAFMHAIKIQPEIGINYANIGSALRELGKTTEACKMYELALSLDSSLEFARENLKRLQKNNYTDFKK